MGKDPAFLFYPGDWLGGTVGMTFEEKGAYMELLMAQFTRGHMTEHMIGRMVGHHWDILKDKFVQDKDGLWFNQRLEDEKEKRKNFVNSRKNNIKGENQHTKSTKKDAHMNGHMTSHMENRNRNEDSNVNKNESKFEIEAYFNAKNAFDEWKEDELFIEMISRVIRRHWRSADEVAVGKILQVFLTNTEPTDKLKTETKGEIKKYLVNWINFNKAKLHEYGQ
jgi:uncharacterized protein YdaU (DUF1376 family)